MGLPQIPLASYPFYRAPCGRGAVVRASVDSFKQGRLRDQLAKMASRQRNLLTVVRTQKELGQKIKEYQNKRKSHTSTANRLTAITEEPHEEFCQLPDTPFTNGGSADEEKENSANSESSVTSESTVSDSNSESILQTKIPIDPRNGTGASDSVVCDYHIENAHKSNRGDLEKTKKDNTQQNQNPINTAFSISAGLTLQKKTSMADSSPQQTTKNTTVPATSLSSLQKDNFPQKTPCQAEQCVVAPPDNRSSTLKIPKPQPNNKQNIPGGKRGLVKLAELITLGKIEPGKDVLEFKVQDSIHKANLLLDGRIRINSGKIYSNPVQWIKTILGQDISVSWKYAFSKVFYLGKELSSYITSEPCLSEEIASPSQQDQIPESLSPPATVTTSGHYLQLNEILLINNREFLPCHIMDQHWKYYLECEDFAF